MKKRGIFFTTDAIIALVIIVFFLIVIQYLPKNPSKGTEVNRDVLTALSKIKVGEVNASENPVLAQILSELNVSDENKSLLEQIGEVYVTNQTLAREMLSEALKNVSIKQNFGIWFDDNLIYAKNTTPIEQAEQIEVARQILSGVKEGGNVTGFSARAFLSGSTQTKYFFFGGYVGDGNLTVQITYTGTITNAKMEAAISDNFELWVNGNLEGTYAGSPDDFTPSTYNLPIDNFHSGTNTIELRGTNIHVAGGFIKINYIGGVEFANFTRYSFPGVKGAINVYDGMYIPGQLNSMDILLHLDSDEDVFLNIGNVTVYNGTTNGEENITISNSLLSSLLDYNSLSSETVPIRIGLINASFQSLTQNADVFSVTDLSGSMEDFCDGGWDVVWCCFFGPGYQECKDNATACQSCGGTHIPKLSNAQEANRVLVNSVLNYSGNRVGLVGFRWAALPDDYHPLSDDNNSLIAEIDSWWAGGGTCICCGINRAVQGFQENWSDSTVKAMVVMSDGIAGTECSEQGTGDARQDAIQAACEAKNNYNITVYAVGFGEGADEATLQSIASCGGGSYYYSTIDQIAQIYSQISQEIIASYQEQTIQVQGAINTTLYPDSYIAINYTSPASNVYGLKAVVEEQFDDAYHASFDIPADVTISEARVTSYSGPRWTSRVFANNTLVYDLSKYGDEFISLGDPYFVYIPPSLLQTGQTNIVNLTTGTTPDNSTHGSAYNKVIYTAFKNATSFTPVLARADGCNWTIDFYDDTQINISVPSNYNGNEQCSYTSGTTGTIASPQDALQVAVLELLRELDFNSDGKVDVKFTSQDLQLSTNEIVDIPYVWSTEVEVRTWV